MPRIRITEQSPISVDLYDDAGTHKRVLGKVRKEPPEEEINWERVRERIEVIESNDGLEIRF